MSPMLTREAFDAWVAKHRPATAIAAVRRHGETVFLKGPQRRSARAVADRQHVEADHRRLHRDADPRRQARLHDAAARRARRLFPPPWRRRRIAACERDDRAAPDASLRPAGNDEDDPMQEIWRRRARAGPGACRLAGAAAGRAFQASGWRTSPAATAPTATPASSCSAPSSRRRPASPTRAIAGRRCSRRSASRARGCIRTGGSSRARAAGSSPPADYLAFLDVFDPEASVSRRPGEGLDRRGRDAMGQGLPRAIRRPRHRDRRSRPRAGR